MTNLPKPFLYPIAPHVRKHGPSGYIDYKSYKPWLRDEFVFRCVYCMEREVWHPSRAGGFSCDHFDSKVIYPERTNDYTNLVYACLRCNSIKNMVPLHLDPSQVGYGEHIHVDDSGEIVASTIVGQQLIEFFLLDVAPAIDVRAEIQLILRAKREQPENPVIDAIFKAKFGFPLDLPDLYRLKPPTGNSNVGSEANSFHAQRERRALPEYY